MTMMRALLVAPLGLCLAASLAAAAERAVLDADNYDLLAPLGKETDAIYGDTVLRNDAIVAVVAAPVDGRDANLTVRNVGGAIIDLTERSAASDQLSCFYPGGGRFRFDEAIAWPDEWESPAPGAAAFAVAGRAISVDADRESGPLAILVGYELRDGEPFVRVTTTLTNPSDASVDASARDGVRADNEFVFSAAPEVDLWWTHDVHWRQAYGLQSETPDRATRMLDEDSYRNPRQIVYPPRGSDTADLALAPGESVTWRRRLFPAKDSLHARAIAAANRGRDGVSVAFAVTDPVGPIAGARVRLQQRGPQGDSEPLGVGVTQNDGRLECVLEAGVFDLEVSAQGYVSRTGLVVEVAADSPSLFEVELPASAYVDAAVTDGAGRPIPAKVQLIGLGETPSPDFGPESAVRGVGNLQYTPDGRFRAKLLPGDYRWLASSGPEYDAAEGRFTVAAGETATIAASLERTVDTRGWLSSELHSHSSPSGDNTASQRGRVLNLLAEHLEFCPCTEHQRIDVYDEHLAHFDAANRMLTCPGMELTGQPLPLNHQNAFPLLHRPRTQHGGAPLVRPDPVEQIKRLAAWDNGSDKVVQSNHPNLAQMIGDRDLDGESDEGFEAMFGSMDVVEVHPPGLIFEPLGPPGDPNSGVGNGGWEGRGAAIVNWLQMLNLGYRVTGVVNTDAHYNFHGSGWLRNWVKSSTDDPAEASVAELVRAFELGHVVISNGPYLEVSARGGTDGSGSAIPGDDLSAPSGEATVRVVVRRPNWLEVNRVQLFLNGRPSEQHNYTVRSHGDWFAAGPEVFDREIAFELDEDTHVVVACCGEDRQLGVIYGEQMGAAMPVAVANPIFIDVDGDADGDGIVFEPNGDDLGLPLPGPDGRKPSHGHDHPNHRHGVPRR